MYDALYVSPHPDDAVFSAGGAIALDVTAGRRVAVATVFSRCEDARRTGEDERALACLGAERVALGFLDAPLREPRLRRKAQRFAPLTERDTALVDTLRSALAPLVGQARVVAPLGIGRHHDHLLVHAACTGLATNIVFYEDIPYALCTALARWRLAELGALPRDSSGAARGGRALVDAARWWAARPLLGKVSPPGLRLPSALLVAWRERSPPSTAATTWREERMDVAAVLDRKLEAIAAYETQWPLFFPTLTAWRVALTADGPTERRWCRA